MKTSPTTLAVQTGTIDMMVLRVHLGGWKASLWVVGRKLRRVRQRTEITSWRRRNVSGSEVEVRTHLLLRYQLNAYESVRLSHIMLVHGHKGKDHRDV